MSIIKSPKIKLIEKFLNQTISITKKDGNDYKLLQEQINNIFIEIGGNKDKYKTEYEELKELFKSYNWNEEILDLAMNDDINSFVKEIENHKENIKQQYKDIMSALSGVLIANHYKYPNIDELILIAECKDKVLMEFKTYIEIYIISKEFDKDLKNNIYKDKNGGVLNSKEFVKEFCKQINERVITYAKKDNTFKIKEKDNIPLIYDEESGKINFKIQNSGQIDVMMLTKYKDNVSHTHILYGVDVTADISGTIDKDNGVKRENLQLIRHHFDFEKITEIFQNKYTNIKLIGEYFFNFPVNVPKTESLKNKSHLSNKNIKKDSISLSTRNLLSLLSKNWHINTVFNTEEECENDRKNIKSFLINEGEIDFKKDVVMDVKGIYEATKLISKISNKEELNNALESLYITKDISSEFKDINLDYLSNFLNTVTELTSLSKRNAQIIIDNNGKKELNKNISINFYNFFHKTLTNKNYKKFLLLENYTALKQGIANLEDFEKIFNKIFDNDNHMEFKDGIYSTIKYMKSDKKLEEKDNEIIGIKQESDKKLEEKDKKLEESKIKENITIIYEIMLEEKDDEKNLKKELLSIKETNNIDFDKYKSNPLLLKKLILKDESLKTLKYCDLTKLSKEEENYIDSLILLNITKNNTMKIIEKYKPISETVTERLTKKYESLKEIYKKYFKDDDKLNEKMKNTIENYLFIKIEENSKYVKNEKSNDINNKKDFEIFLNNIKDNKIILFNSNEIEKRLKRNNDIPNFGM